MRILHCADIHLDSKLSTNLDANKRKRRQDELLQGFVRMIDWAANNDVDAILIAGDLFDTAHISKTTAGFIESSIAKNCSISFYFLKGNHDCDSFMQDIEGKYENLYLFSEEWSEYTLDLAGRIRLNGVELTSRNADRIYDDLYLSPDCFNIVMLHGQMVSYKSKDMAQLIDLSALKNRSIDYLALGHIHQFVKGSLDSRGMYCYPGCLEGRGFDECGQHGFVVIDIDEDTYRYTTSFVPWGLRNLFELDVDISDCEDTVMVSKAISLALKEATATSKDMVQINLVGEREAQNAIDIEYISHQLEDMFFCARLTDKSQLLLNYSRYAYDKSLKGEFVRVVMSQDSLDEEMKAKIISQGIDVLLND